MRTLVCSPLLAVAGWLTGIQQHQQHPFNGPLSRTTRVSQYQKGKTNLDLLEQEIVSDSNISWAICKYAALPKQITMPTLHHSVFLQAGCLPVAQPTAPKHWRQRLTQVGWCNDCKWVLLLRVCIWDHQTKNITHLLWGVCYFYLSRCYSIAWDRI